jgi:hypothetical protein
LEGLLGAFITKDITKGIAGFLRGFVGKKGFCNNVIKNLLLLLGFRIFVANGVRFGGGASELPEFGFYLKNSITLLH